MPAFSQIPLLWDLYSYYWVFPRKGVAHRGVFRSFEEATAACPKGKRLGHNQEIIADRCHPVMQNAERRIGSFDPRDYPVLVWLARALEDGSSVLDLGGNVGLGYYAYRRFISYPTSLRWVVCEIPQLCQAGRRLAREHKAEGLEFTEEFAQGDGSGIILSCGTLQFLESSLAQLVLTLKRKPRHILIQRVPLGDERTFYTMENVGYAYCPYRVQNKQELFDSLAAQGYDLIDSWKDSKLFRIPFHPRRTVNGYHGAYFRLRET
jgi:putative methyltransferase (TIGR04325 family)